MEKQAKKFMKSAKSSLSKAKRTYVCRSLKDLIKAYRACTTRSEERALVKKEAAHIRDLFREGDKAFRRQNIAKLLFFHMNGYPTDFGMTECIKLCASNKYSDKRVAYLGLMILVDETEEILMLMTNCLKQDLHSQDLQIVSLALNVLGDIASVEMVRDLMPEIEMHLGAQNAYIRKKATLAAVRAVKKLGPEETANVLSVVPAVFKIKSAAVHISGTALISAICQQSSSNVPDLQMTMTPVLLDILRDHLLAPKHRRAEEGYSDTIIGGVRNPFLQVKLISALRLLVESGIPSNLMDDISDVLAQVAANTDGKKVAGCAVLYECVRTIVSLNTEPSLRAMAVNILGKFLTHKEATVRYIALEELIRVVDADGPDVLVNITGYKDKILAGLRESDPTVRKRAVELVYRIADSSNMVQMVTELLGYLKKSSSPALAEDACWKIFLIMDRLGAPFDWRVEMFVKALGIADMSMPEELITSFLAMVSSTPEVQPHAVLKLFNEALRPCLANKAGDLLDQTSAISSSSAADSSGSESHERQYKRRPRLERVALYILGEYGEATPHVGLDIPLVLDVFERMMGYSAIVEELWTSSSGPAYELENKVMGEVALTGLVKFACRAICGSHEALSMDMAEKLAITSGRNEDDQTGLGSLLAITAAPTAGREPQNTGLGTDLLDSMGLGGGSNSGPIRNFGRGALVPADNFPSATANSEMGSLISMDPNANDASGNPIVRRVRQILYSLTKSLELETQQRACEYISLLEEERYSTLAATMSPMPSLDFRKIQERARQRKELRTARSMAATGPGSGLLLDLFGDSAGVDSSGLALPAPPGSELLALPPTNPSSGAGPSSELTLEDIMGGGPGFGSGGDVTSNGQSTLGTGSTPQVASVLPPSQPGNGAGASGGLTLEDIMTGAPNIAPSHSAALNGQQAGVDTVISAQTVPDSTQEIPFAPEPDTNQEDTALLSLTIVDSPLLVIYAQFFRDDVGDATNVRAELSFRNKSESSMSSFTFLLAVPKYIKLRMHPASASEIEAGGEASQSVNLINSLHGQKGIQLRYRVEYSHDGTGEVVQEQGVVKGLQSL